MTETSGFHRHDGEWYCDGVSLANVVQQCRPPFYVYSLDGLTKRFRAITQAFEPARPIAAVALKANSQPALLRPLFNEGAGAEVVSGAELMLALALGCPPDRIVFSGVGKTSDELLAGLDASIRLFVVESESELATLSELAERREIQASVALRLNPDIDPQTHPHIATGVASAKFGFDPSHARRLFVSGERFPALSFRGVHSHIGSQITTTRPLEENAALLAELVREMRASGVVLSEIDVGGGWGIDYEGVGVPSLRSYADAITKALGGLDAQLIIEPGRVLFGPIGAFVAEVVAVKAVHGRGFVVLNAGMNDFLRPALYDAFHRIEPVVPRQTPEREFDIAGAVCESSDVFGRERRMPEPQRGDSMVILDAGAYGFVMSSNYNLRPRPAELVIDEETIVCVREAESWQALVERELLQ